MNTLVGNTFWGLFFWGGGGGSMQAPGAALLVY